MRRRLFWLLLGWSFGVLASNWMENRFRKTVNRYARNTVSRLGFMPEEILSKRSEVSGWFREFELGPTYLPPYMTLGSIYGKTAIKCKSN